MAQTKPYTSPAMSHALSTDGPKHRARALDMCASADAAPLLAPTILGRPSFCGSMTEEIEGGVCKPTCISEQESSTEPAVTSQARAPSDTPTDDVDSEVDEAVTDFDESSDDGDDADNAVDAGKIAARLAEQNLGFLQELEKTMPHLLPTKCHKKAKYVRKVKWLMYQMQLINQLALNDSGIELGPLFLPSVTPSTSMHSYSSERSTDTATV